MFIILYDFLLTARFLKSKINRPMHSLNIYLQENANKLKFRKVWFI